MNTDDIHVDHFRESIKIAQRLVYISISLVILIAYTGLNDAAHTNITIPLIGINVTSHGAFTTFLSWINFILGIYCLVNILRAYNHYKTIQDNSVSIAILSYPSIFNINSLLKFALCFIYFFIWCDPYKYWLVNSIYGVGIILPVVVTGPFLVAMYKAEYIKQ